VPSSLHAQPDAKRVFTSLFDEVRERALCIDSRNSPPRPSQLCRSYDLFPDILQCNLSSACMRKAACNHHTTHLPYRNATQNHARKVPPKHRPRVVAFGSTTAAPPPYKIELTFASKLCGNLRATHTSTAFRKSWDVWIRKVH
jgi:hypothetical protein